MIGRLKDKMVSSNNNSLFTSLLTILFIGLKLTGYINWSWWWVLSPLWITLGLAMLIWGIIILIAKFKKNEPRTN